MRIYTKTLSSGTLSVATADGVTQISIQANNSSSATIIGNFPFQGVAATNITLNDGQSITLVTAPNSPLDGMTVTWVSGTIDILIGF